MDKVTLAAAKQHIGDLVVYRPFGQPVEQGVITSVNDRYVFVRYGADITAKATEPSHLEWLILSEPNR